MDLTLFSAAMTSLGVIKTTAEGLLSARDEAKLMEAKIELLSQVIEVMQAMQSLQLEHQRQLDTNRSQEERLTQLQKLVSERESYELHEVRSGAFVYARKPASGEDNEPPYVCQPCYDSGSKMVLRYRKAATGVDAEWTCAKEPSHSISLGGALPKRGIPIRRS